MTAKFTVVFVTSLALASLQAANPFQFATSKDDNNIATPTTDFPSFDEVPIESYVEYPSHGGAPPANTDDLGESPEGHTFNFNNNGEAVGGGVPVIPGFPFPFPDQDGDGQSDSTDVPVISGFPFPDQDGGGQSNSTEVGGACHPDYCVILNPCGPSKKCVTTKECNRTVCVDVIGTGPQSAAPVKVVHHCADTISCEDITFCADIYDCNCQEGWAGTRCMFPCNLTCLHGNCRVDQDLATNKETMYCNCEVQWTGLYCDIPVEDPVALESKALAQEQKAKILAVALSVAVVIVVLSTIITPIVLWRMRVIFVLKLVYYFKEYEDDDGKLYDAYVSLTSTSHAEKFVQAELLPKLENLGFKLYVQARDCPAGEVLSETILTAVEKSRRTIMVITPDYVGNEWSRFEYLIAQHETLKLNQKIIPIILEEVDQNDLKVNKSLKHILQSVKCLKYPQMNSLRYGDSENIEDLSSSPCSEKQVNLSSISYPTTGASVTKNIADKSEEKFWKRLELTMPKKKKHRPKKKGSTKLQNEIFSKSQKSYTNPEKGKPSLTFFNIAVSANDLS